MSAWGQGGSLKSCDSLLKRVEGNDSELVELVILPMKNFGGAELDRLSTAVANGSNTNLKSISASGHAVPPASLKRFGLALSSQSKQQEQTGEISGITHLAIGSKEMGDEGVIALCEGLIDSNGGLIQSLDLGLKNIGKDGVCKIGGTFAWSKHFTHLDLSRNENIGCNGMAAFCYAATQAVGENGTPFSALEQLIFSECNIGVSGVDDLAKCLRIRGKDDGHCQRVHLNLSLNPIGNKGCDSISQLCAMPSFGSVLSKLQLSQCSIKDGGVKTLSSAAKCNPFIGLTALDLSNNSISHFGAEVLADSLHMSWPDLVELNLAKNDLGSAGVVMIIKSLRQRSDITIDHPVISNETIMVIKSLVQQSDTLSGANSTLKSLDLTETNCGIEGASAALMSGGLTSLRLFNNNLGSDGFYSVSNLLQGGHPSIEHLDLGGNSADEDSVVALLDAIGNLHDDGTSNSKLSVLEIGGNNFGDKADAALKRLKSVWPKLDVAHDKPVQNRVDEE